MSMVAVSMTLASCSALNSGLEVGTIPSAPPATVAQPAGVGADSAVGYRLSAGDKVRSTVFNEPSLSGEFTVDGRGKISYPLIGDVDTKGLTVSDLARSITGKLKGRYLVKPQVTLEVVSVRPVYIIGEVRTPGEYPFRPGMNVVSAVALAGGFAPRANSSFVYVKRMKDATEQRHSDIANIVVQPGDIIRVDERYF